MRYPRLLVLIAAIVVAASACGSSESIEVDGAWARPSPRMADAGAVYMELTADAADRLIGAAVDPSVAGMVEIHETVMAEMGDGMGEGEEMGEGMGAMTMQEVGEITLPAGETVALEPGGLHIMLMRLPTPLEMGQTFEVTLTFENADEKVVEVEVREEAP